MTNTEGAHTGPLFLFKETYVYKRDITYEDLEGNKITETFYFNLNKAETLALQARLSGKEGDILSKAIDDKDAALVVAEVEDLVLSAYGEKSPDGKSFIKSAESRQWFKGTNAYGELIMELAADEKAAQAFMTAVFPAGMVEVGTPQDKPASPPPAPELPFPPATEI